MGDRSLKRAPAFFLWAGMAVAFLSARADPVDDLVRTQMAQQRIPGLAIVALKNGEIVKVAAYGVANVETAEPMTTSATFRLQSVSKQFTAAAVLLLVEAGKIGLDDPIERHLADCPNAWRMIRVRHLLNQTSGLPDFINEPTVDLKVVATDEALMASVATRPLKFEPGAAWAYSNTNYHLLAMIVGRASGGWYGDFLAERIFRPLGMTATAVVRDRDTLNRTRGYFLENDQLRPGVVLAPVVASYGGGGVCSTVLDLAKWDAALSTERLLKRATWELAWTPALLSNGTTHPYGFGWDIEATAGHRRFSHRGNWTGFTAQIDRYVDDRLTVVVLANLSGANTGRIARAIAGTYVPALAAPSYTPIADNEPAVTARFVDVLRRTAEGKLRAAEFDAGIWAYIEPRVDQFSRDFTRFGPIQKLTLVERTDGDGVRSYRYQARFARTTMIFHFVLTKEDRISVMMPEQVNQ